MRNFWRDIKQYPTAIVGTFLVLAIVALAIYAMVSLPYEEAVILWRANEEDTYLHPEKAPPVWVNWFRAKKLPEGFHCVVSDEGAENVVVEDNTKDGLMDVTYHYSFDFNSDEFLQDMGLHITTTYNVKQPFVEASMTRPDGSEVRVVGNKMKQIYRYRFSQDPKLKRRVGALGQIGVFATPESIKAGEPEVMKGTYVFNVRVRGFEPDTTIKTEVIAHGRVYGIAGTDHKRRDITTALLWGAPFALMFGLIAAFGVSVLTMTISATGTWYGGFVDGIIQRITEVNMMLPFLPILIMVGTFYSRSIWTILGTVILLSIFSTSIKTYRATFMQVKNSTYIEAAKVYGASNARIIFKYMIPKIIPMLIPTLVLSIPSYVFLEASLSILGLGDPTIPTWGKLIQEARVDGALWNGQYYWILEPAALLIITGFAFAMVGFALDKIFNPRLRDQ